jgi:serine/threonine-protein kinase RCK2
MISVPSVRVYPRFSVRNSRSCRLAKDLIQHLLCVNPSERSTITEFLEHPWCKQEHSLFQPSLPSPPLPVGTLRPLDSPLLRGHARESPGIAALKEAFDITYAVHRMEEENARRRVWGAGARGWLGELNEDAEDESDEVPTQERGWEKRKEAAYGWQNPKKERDHGRAAPAPPPAGGQRDRGRRVVEGSRSGRFELDLEGATSLGRRHEGQKRTSGNAVVVTGAPMGGSTKESVGSPMRVG